MDEKEKIVDLFVFSGQSNMAGRGTAKEAPNVPAYKGMEFRAITEPNRLVPICEPFGRNENKQGGINDTGRKTGSMVSSFVCACYEETKTKVIALSASEGGTDLDFWRVNGPAFSDLRQRIRAAFLYLKKENYQIRTVNFVWMQGETDGDKHNTKEYYKRQLNLFFDAVKNAGMEQIFLIPIGCYNGMDPGISYEEIRKAQIEVAQERTDTRLSSMLAKSFKSRGLMKDDFHYVQQAYNELGEEAGRYAGKYLSHL